LKINQLVKGRFQSRKVVDDQYLLELAQTIKQFGVIQPIVVRPLDVGNKYEILAGERRWLAAQKADLDIIPAIVRSVDDRTASAITMIENLQRQDLNPIEEALAINRLINEFELSQGKVAEIIGKSQSAVSRCLGLLELTSTVREHIQEGRLEAGHGKVLLNLDNAEQEHLANAAIQYEWSVRELEQKKTDLLKDKTTVREHTRQRRDPDIVRMENQLQQIFKANVNLKYNANKGNGSIVIRFNSLDEYDGIIECFRQSRDR
jgi:ParB family chromosome partitioning protein